MSDILIGHDGEFFLDQGGEIVTSRRIIPGNKSNPAQFKSCMIHRDNVMGEFGTKEAGNVDDFVNNITTALSEIDYFLEERGCKTVFKPHHIFKPEQLNYLEARRFGCEPDFDCWGVDESPPPSSITAGCLRSAGGHLHAGFDFKDELDARKAVFSAEVFVGLYTVMEDEDTKRRALYGRAGRFRPKPYGIEYRVPSNFWYNDVKHMQQMFTRMKAAIWYRNEMAEMIGNQENAMRIISAINNSDKVAATELWSEYHVEELLNAY